VSENLVDYAGLPDASLDSTDLAALEHLDPGSVDWHRVQRTAYLVYQHVRYDYPGPIADLHQRLVMLPPRQFGDQRLVMQRLDVTPVPASRVESQDDFGNTVVTLEFPLLEESVSFEAWIVVERRSSLGPIRLPAIALTDRRLLEPSPMTMPDGALREAAAMLAGSGTTEWALAERIAEWTHSTIHYEHGATGVRTTAAQALALGRGVCQDHAHVMIALCRICGLPARYASGHLLGEGGTHAWVEVLLRDSPHSDTATIWSYDPANGCPVSLRYVTIAVGRDYGDVAPTSGTFRASYGGALRAHKRVGLTVAEYTPVS
jgi:transglutaminase-like putative cysteine protease